MKDGVRIGIENDAGVIDFGTPKDGYVILFIDGTTVTVFKAKIDLKSLISALGPTLLKFAMEKMGGGGGAKDGS